MSHEKPSLAIVIPAAGIGKRMQSSLPKQYLTIHGKTVLEHTIEQFVELDYVECVVVALAEHDTLFSTLAISRHPKVTVVAGGEERGHSVFNGLTYLQSENIEWVMVHDAARPCVQQTDIETLFVTCVNNNSAAILANPVRDTMKRAHAGQAEIKQTVDRNDLWHALTPQCCRIQDLYCALSEQFDQDNRLNPEITDEASALELAGQSVQLVSGSVKNIKITHPEDLELASFYLAQH